MTVFLFFLGILQCVLIWAMGQAGLALAAKARQGHELAKTAPPEGWPRCALLIPVSGTHPAMDKALRSLLDQDYPYLIPYIITATDSDAAMGFIERLKDDYPALRHVVAGPATASGQKNHNLLAGIQEARGGADVYAFCDSTHIAPPDFLRCLINPIARGEAAFSTGYHQVEPGDGHIATLGYAMSVLFMRLLQGMAALTQPWGGAMAIRKSAFEHYGIAELWRTNVVDDCSLAGWLAARGLRVQLCPAALLLTYARDHAFPVWKAWLERQILFLKFCIPSQWLGLGLLCLFMAAPPVWAGVCFLRGLLGLGSDMAPFLALCWLCAIAWAVNGWRVFLPAQASPSRWLWAFFFSCFMFFLTYFGSFFSKSILWQGVAYEVGRAGKVKDIRRQ